MIKYKNPQGDLLKPTYLKTIQSELSALFNHAVRFYELKENPVVKAGPLGKGKADIDIAKSVIHITKSYQRIKGKDVVTDPKTPKSKRDIVMPNFLCEELQDYMNQLYGVTKQDRLFHITKTYLHHEMDRGAKKAGVQRIRIHDLRHSHVSLLINMGFTAVAIAKRVGHESSDITFRYAHMFPSEQLEMATMLNDAYDVTTKKGDIEV